MGIWQRNYLLIWGPLASQLEMELKDYLDVKHLLFVTTGLLHCNGKKALELRGEIITTPFLLLQLLALSFGKDANHFLLWT